jgi:hypothetical protein
LNWLNNDNPMVAGVTSFWFGLARSVKMIWFGVPMLIGSIGFSGHSVKHATGDSQLATRIAIFVHGCFWHRHRSLRATT